MNQPGTKNPWDESFKGYKILGWNILGMYNLGINHHCITWSCYVSSKGLNGSSRPYSKEPERPKVIALRSGQLSAYCVAHFLIPKNHQKCKFLDINGDLDPARKKNQNQHLWEIRLLSPKFWSHMEERASVLWSVINPRPCAAWCTVFWLWPIVSRFQLMNWF
jgi:hypothetical protein